MNDDKDWIGEPRANWEPQIVPSDDVYSTLKKNGAELVSKEIGLDGEPLESPVSYGSEEVVPLKSPVLKSAEPAKNDSPVPVSEHITKMAGILSSLLRELMATGATQSWISSEGKPDQRFVSIEVGHLKEAIELLTSPNERKVVYRILKDEVSVKRERERIVGDILLKFAFPNC